MLDDVVDALRCPVCAGPLSRHSRVLRCPAGHSYDIARQGHVTLLAGQTASGDTAAMVAAREAFLGSGHYDWLADAITAVAAELMGFGRISRGFAERVVDAGAGTGFYLAHVLERIGGRTRGIAVDSSGHSLRRAARAHPRIGAIGADLWRPLPIADGAAGLVLNIFAPRNGEEFHRILSPGGRLLTVTPTRRHLAALVERLDLLSVDEDKERKLADTLGACFHLQRRERRDHTMTLDHEAVAALVG
ncbi:MAG: putative RNA methyltransferase, partial [Dehalococcoidia bacterium]